jgi:hypothetical protein
MITVTPASPIVETVTITKNVLSFVITSILVDSAANQVSINFNRVLESGATEPATIIECGDDALAFLSRVANPNETFLSLIARAAS